MTAFSAGILYGIVTLTMATLLWHVSPAASIAAAVGLTILAQALDR